MTDSIVHEKQCSRCRVVKPASEFHKCNDRPSGLASFCKLCNNGRRSKQGRAAYNEAIAKAAAECPDKEKCKACGVEKPAYAFHPKSGFSQIDRRCRSCSVRCRSLDSQNKTCTLCGVSHTAANFSKDRSRPDGLNNKCRKCSAKINKRWWRRNGMSRGRWGRISNTFNLTRKEYEKMWKEQGGKCAICRRAPEALKKPLYVDHDHSTNKVRGLLCSQCNVALGMMQDDVKKLRAAIHYLLKHSSSDSSVRTKADESPQKALAF